MALDLRGTADVDRRRDAGLAFDPTTGGLALGPLTVVLDPSVANRDVLQAYVNLAASVRGQRLTELVEVRQADIDALAAALDLDADDLVAEIEAVLGASKAEALRLVGRLRESRLIGGITRAAVGAVVAGTLVAACSTPGSNGDASVKPTPIVHPSDDDTTAAGDEQPVTDAEGRPVTEDEHGVGLIQPASVDQEPVHLIPPKTVDRPAE